MSIDKQSIPSPCNEKWNAQFFKMVLLFVTTLSLIMTGCIAPKPVKKTTSNVRYATVPFHYKMEKSSTALI